VRAWIIVAVLFWSAACVAWAQEEAQPGRPATLVIYYTNDDWGFLDPCNCGDRSEGGLARRAALLAELRAQDEAEGKSVLVVDAGNVLSRTEPSNVARHRTILSLMKKMRYDALNLGYLELDQPLSVLEPMFEGNSIALVSSNLSGGNLALQPYVLKATPDLTIGVLGIASTSSPPPPLGRLSIGDPFASAQAAAEALRAAGAQLIIALVSSTFVDPDQFLAQLPPTVDVVIGLQARHSLTEPTQVAGKVLAVCRPYGLDLGRLELTLDPSANPVVQAFGGEVYPLVLSLPEDPVVAALVEQLRAQEKSPAQ